MAASLLTALLAYPAAAQEAPDPATSDSALTAGTVVTGGGDNYKPFHYNAGGQPSGFDVDLTRAIARVMGLDLEIKLAYWQEIRDGLADGSVQVHIGMTHSPERADRFDFTTPYLTQQYKIFITDDTRGIAGEEDLAGKRIIVQEDGVMASYLEARGDAAQIVAAATAAEALRLLELGKGDCCLMTEFRGLTVAQDLGLDNVRRVGKPIHSTRYGFAVARGNDDLVLALNQGLALLKRSGEYDRIYEAWFGVLGRQGLTTRDYVRVAVWIVLPLGLALLLAALWSWSLRRQVVRQTAELRHARDQAEAASRAKSRFLTAVSHEIRTPLNGVLGMTQLLAGGVTAPDQLEQVGTIKRSATKLHDIINDILEFSRIETGGRELDHLDFSPRDVLDEVMETAAPDAWSKGLVVTSQVADSVPERVNGDPAALRQILVSLVGNAIKFTSQGSVDVVLAKSGEDGPSVRLQGDVADTGVGVPEAQRAALFEAFTQADTSSTRCHGGTGLGLAICRHLTGLMAGTVAHEPRDGGGSVFRFEVVLEPAQAPPPVAPTATADATAITDPILVVEDNPTNQRVVALLLKKWGYASELAENGEEAVAACRQRRFAAIIMDCQMPVMDGLEATRIIRGLDGQRTPRTPIIALTAGADLASREQCLAVGMDDYLNKPVNAARLREVLLACLADAQQGAVPVSQA